MTYGRCRHKAADQKGASSNAFLAHRPHSPSVSSEPGHDSQGPPIFEIVVLRLEAVVRGPAHARRFRREGYLSADRRDATSACRPCVNDAVTRTLPSGYRPDGEVSDV